MDGNHPYESVPPQSRARDDYCNAKWNEALKICELNLSEGERAYFQHIKSFEAFKENLSKIEVQQQGGQSILQKTASIFEPLLSFATLLAACLSSSTVETAIVWGLLFLLLRVRARISFTTDSSVIVSNHLHRLQAEPRPFFRKLCL
jgi:hypothetical protein